MNLMSTCMKKFIAFPVLLCYFSLFSMNTIHIAKINQILAMEDDEEDLEDEEDEFEETREEDSIDEKEETFEEEREIVLPDEPSEELEESGPEYEPGRDAPMTRRERELLSYQEPDLAKVVRATYLYESDSFFSKKLFELFEGDEIVVILKDERWYKVEFLGKIGWVAKDDAILNIFHPYALIVDFAAGISASGDIESDLLTNYNLSLLYNVYDDYLYIGGEFKTLISSKFSSDSNASFTGGGVVLRSYIPFINTKKSRTAFQLSAGYMQALDVRIYPDGFYLSASSDWMYRLFERFYGGAGLNITYMSASGEIQGGTSSTGEFSKSFFVPGFHLKFMYNILR